MPSGALPRFFAASDPDCRACIAAIAWACSSNCCCKAACGDSREARCGWESFPGSASAYPHYIKNHRKTACDFSNQQNRILFQYSSNHTTNHWLMVQSDQMFPRVKQIRNTFQCQGLDVCSSGFQNADAVLPECRHRDASIPVVHLLTKMAKSQHLQHHWYSILPNQCSFWSFWSDLFWSSQKLGHCCAGDVRHL